MRILRFTTEGKSKYGILDGTAANILWLMPIHPLGEKLRKGTIGSPYAVRDYYAINPDYGTEADLKRLAAEAHKRGLKVIIDVFANHTAWDSVLMQRPEFYKKDAAGKIIPPVKEWTDVAGLDYQTRSSANTCSRCSSTGLTPPPSTSMASAATSPTKCPRVSGRKPAPS